MNVNLSPELEELVNEKVRSGRYENPSQVVSEALTLLKDQDELGGLSLEYIRREVALGLKDLDEGRSAPLNEKMLEDIKARGRARLAAENQNKNRENVH